MLTAMLAFAVTGLLGTRGHLVAYCLPDYLIAAPLPLANFLLVALLLWLLLLSTSSRTAVLRTTVLALLNLEVFRTMGAVTLQSFSCSVVLSYWISYSLPQGFSPPSLVALVGLWALLAGTYAFSRVLQRGTRR